MCASTQLSRGKNSFGWQRLRSHKRACRRSLPSPPHTKPFGGVCRGVPNGLPPPPVRFIGARRLGLSGPHGGTSSDVDTAALLFKQQLRAKLPRSIQEFEAGGGRIVQFAAVVASKEATATDVNDVSVVVGAIDAQVEASVRARTFELPDRVHVKNLRVHENYRRKGIGRALLSAVEQFALGETTRTATPEAVTLKVEQHSNPKAVQLYEQEGFVFQEQVYFGFMLKTINRKE